MFRLHWAIIRPVSILTIKTDEVLRMGSHDKNIQIKHYLKYHRMLMHISNNAGLWLIKWGSVKGGGGYWSTCCNNEKFCTFPQTFRMIFFFLRRIPIISRETALTSSSVAYSQFANRNTRIGRTGCSYNLHWREIQADQNVSMRLMITVQDTQKYFKKPQSLAMIT
jgi:hypothetical protein